MERRDLKALSHPSLNYGIAGDMLVRSGFGACTERCAAPLN